MSDPRRVVWFAKKVWDGAPGFQFGIFFKKGDPPLFVFLIWKTMYFFGRQFDPNQTFQTQFRPRGSDFPWEPVPSVDWSSFKDCDRDMTGLLREMPDMEFRIVALE